MKNSLCELLNLQYPIIQAPMAGVSTPELAAAVSNAGALGSISIGAANPEQAELMIQKTLALSSGPVNVNVFCHQAVQRDEQLEKAWIKQFHELFVQYDAQLPGELEEIYTTFHNNSLLLDILLNTRPAAVSFHFGIPASGVINLLKQKGIITLATATSIDEAKEIEASGIDFIVAQGIEAGGHRGIFDPMQADSMLSTFTLVQAIKHHCRKPVIAAGGIMNGAGIAAMLALGAEGAQLGTAFVLCPESSANSAYREALKSKQAANTVLTSAISGRPARCIENAFCTYARDFAKHTIPSYPLTYALGKALASAAAAKGDHGFGAQWAGQGAQLAREMSAQDLVLTLVDEMHAARN